MPNLLMKLFFFFLNAVFAMALLDLIFRVHPVSYVTMLLNSRKIPHSAVGFDVTFCTMDSHYLRFSLF